MPNTERVTPGQVAKNNPLIKDAAVINDVLGLVGRNSRGELTTLGRTRHPAPLGTDFVMVRNDTGAARERGEVVQLGAYLCTADTDIRHPWFEGNTPADPLWKCAILAKPAPEDEIVEAHCSGVCVAKVDVQNTGDTHAIPVDGEHVLHSTTSGPIELLSVPSSTGAQIMLVRFGAELYYDRVYATGQKESVPTPQYGILHELGTLGSALGFDASGSLTITTPRRAGMFGITVSGSFWWRKDSQLLPSHDVGRLQVIFGVGTVSGNTFSPTTPFFETPPMVVPTTSTSEPTSAPQIKATHEFCFRFHQQLEAQETISVKVRVPVTGGGNTSIPLNRHVHLAIERI